MNFSFGFSFDSDSNIDNKNSYNNSNIGSSNNNISSNNIDTEDDIVLESIEVKPLDILRNNNIKSPSIEFNIGEYKFNKISSHFHSGLDKDLDIIPGKYEGGYKVWECTIDLVVHIIELVHSNQLYQTSVLELGCGNGYPGIIAMKLGFQPVIFSDLNVEVLEQVTWPNIYINNISLVNKEIDIKNNIKCFSGDWLSLSKLIESRIHSDIPTKYGLIVSAETLYTKDCCIKILQLILNHLDIDGIALIASKRYYFGVGGGTDDLRNLVKDNGELSCSTVKVYEDGYSNIREIIKIERKKK